MSQEGTHLNVFEAKSAEKRPNTRSRTRAQSTTNEVPDKRGDVKPDNDRPKAVSKRKSTVPTKPSEKVAMAKGGVTKRTAKKPITANKVVRAQVRQAKKKVEEKRAVLKRTTAKQNNTTEVEPPNANQEPQKHSVAEANVNQDTGPQNDKPAPAEVIDLLSAQKGADAPKTGADNPKSDEARELGDVTNQEAQEIVAAHTTEQAAQPAATEGGSGESSLSVAEQDAVPVDPREQGELEFPYLDFGDDVPDIDTAQMENPLLCAQYAQSIYNFYYAVEPFYLVPPNYMDKQAEITGTMRGILVDWIVEVHLKFQLMPDTLFLAINYIDRFLANNQTPKTQLQLVGCAGLLMASKYEEVWGPEINDYIYISDRVFTKADLVKMERKVWVAIDMDLSTPTIYTFLLRFLRAAGSFNTKNIALLTAYLGELALVDYKMLKYKYSEIAAAACYIARLAFGQEDVYPEALAKHSRYSEAHILPCVKDLLRAMKSADEQRKKAKLNPKAETVPPMGVVRKYEQKKFGSIAKIAVPKLPGGVV